ncbi:MAG: bifunctional riboflavin kinase/FAD synthetase [Clostridia bacterium]|nr:bifunctional riboflavin kinase/FAD synthetase [Clostridia bacterium]
MKIFDLKKEKCIKNTDKPLCLLLGNFDGVHEGHMSLVDFALQEGKRQNVKVAVWTFSEHPLGISGKGIKTLTDNDEKNEIFAQKGVDYVIYEDFSKVKNMCPLDFINDVLIGKFDCVSAVCGFNFKFGKNGSGNAEMLREEMEKAGRSTVVCPPVYRMDKVVSSTEIRAYLENGMTEEAAVMLGRNYSIVLPVLHGNELGRTIGIPTINQRFPENRIKPKRGIYAVKCYVGGKEYYGVANVGSRPTVNNNESDVNCETHIIGYKGWIYGENVKVCFYKRLRDERRFDDINELKTAVQNDIEQTMLYFESQK